MSDKLEDEFETLKARREAIHNDLKKLVAELSAPSQVLLMIEAARLDVEIQEMKKELETMAFEEFMREKWYDNDR